jgi:hypothetical protein
LIIYIFIYTLFFICIFSCRCRQNGFSYGNSAFYKNCNLSLEVDMEGVCYTFFFCYIFYCFCLVYCNIHNFFFIIIIFLLTSALFIFSKIEFGYNLFRMSIFHHKSDSLCAINYFILFFYR